MSKPSARRRSFPTNERPPGAFSGRVRAVRPTPRLSGRWGCLQWGRLGAKLVEPLTFGFGSGWWDPALCRACPRMKSAWVSLPQLPARRQSVFKKIKNKRGYNVLVSGTVPSGHFLNTGVLESRPGTSSPRCSTVSRVSWGLVDAFGALPLRGLGQEGPQGLPWGLLWRDALLLGSPTRGCLGRGRWRMVGVPTARSLCTPWAWLCLG